MYFEIFHEGKLIKRGKEILGDLDWSNELMFVPSTRIELPIEYREFLNGHDELKIHVNNKTFWGIITRLSEDKDDETITVDLDHVVYEWSYRQISVNNAIKDEKINVVYKGSKVETTGSVSVSASDFNIYIPEVGNLTNAELIERAGATAWKENGDPVAITRVDTSNITMVPEEYDITFGTTMEEYVTVKVTVKRLPDSHTREKDGITVCATDFELGYDENLTDEEYMQRAYAVAWDEDGNEVEVEDVDASEVDSEPGEYEVSFTAGEAEVTITVTRLEEGEEPEDPFPFIKPLNLDPSIIDELADVYADTNFAYPGWRMNYEHGAQDFIVDYVYSRQDKLDALTKTMELSPDLFWRVRFVNERVIDISPFGDKHQLMLSTKPSGPVNVRMITEPVIRHEFDDVINLATVYSEKSDTGMSSMTLREVYNDPDLQVEGFPVVILRSNVNNERDYRMYSDRFPKLAPNNELEYAVIDEESVALESGTIIEGTFAFNDLSPFEVEKDGETQEVTDEDRIQAAQTAYNAAIKKLKLARRTYSLRFDVEELPAEVAPGDMVRLLYDNTLYIVKECSAYLKKILSYDDWFYITRIDYHIDENGGEVDTVTLEKFIKIDRENG